MISSLRLVVLVPLASYLPGTSQECGPYIQDPCCSRLVSSEICQTGLILEAQGLLFELGTGILSA
jgi:hypothetical protein